MIPSIVVKAAIAKTSSTLPAAIHKVGIPFSTPSPCSEAASIPGTTTAGETAESANLKWNADD